MKILLFTLKAAAFTDISTVPAATVSFFILFPAMAVTAISTIMGGATAAGRTANALYSTFS